MCWERGVSGLLVQLLLLFSQWIYFYFSGSLFRFWDKDLMKSVPF